MNDKIIIQIASIASIFPYIDKTYLFGSRAHGDATERSNIDLAVQAPLITDRDWLNFCDQIEDEVTTLLKIDVVRYDTASDLLHQEIDNCYKLLYEKQ